MNLKPCLELLTIFITIVPRWQKDHGDVSYLSKLFHVVFQQKTKSEELNLKNYYRFLL